MQRIAAFEDTRSGSLMCMLHAAGMSHKVYDVSRMDNGANGRRFQKLSLLSQDP